ncbi:hypothetical protein SERLA73DRAFT_140905, partial [Serpula lacrymans var. lacrymans S7.3]
AITTTHVNANTCPTSETLGTISCTTPDYPTRPGEKKQADMIRSCDEREDK